MDLFRYKRKGSSASVGVVLCGVLFAAGTNGFLCVPPRTQQKDPVAPVSGGAIDPSAQIWPDHLRVLGYFQIPPAIG